MPRNAQTPFVVIVGTGSQAVALAEHLDHAGLRTAIVGGDPSEWTDHGDASATIRICGNALDPSEQVMSVIRRADLVVAAGEDDDTNALVALIARKTIGAKRVVAIVVQPTRTPTYDRFDLTTIRPHDLIGQAIQRLAACDDDVTHGKREES